jgi:hypothetical protein
LKSIVPPGCRLDPSLDPQAMPRRRRLMGYSTALSET